MALALAKLVSRLSVTTDRLVERLGTDSFFVLRAAKTGNGKGGTLKTYNPTGATAHGCFYSLVDRLDSLPAAVRATQRKNVIHYRFNVPATTDITQADRLRLVARAPVGQKDLEVVHVADPIGLTRLVIAVEEVPTA